MLQQQVLSHKSAHLLPKLQCYFAQFLHSSSLTRLSILYSSTCVGFSTVYIYVQLSNFSWKHGFCLFIYSSVNYHSRLSINAIRIYLNSCLHDLSSNSNCQRSIAFSVITSHLYIGTGILTCCPSTSLFSFALGPTNPPSIYVAGETLDFRRGGF